MPRPIKEKKKRGEAFRTYFTKDEISIALENNGFENLTNFINNMLGKLIDGKINENGFSKEDILYIMEFFQRNKDHLHLNPIDRDFFKDLVRRAKGNV